MDGGRTDPRSNPDLARPRAVAEDAALAGTRVVLGAARPSEAETKSAGDYVTEADRASEAAIGEVLRLATPDIPVLGEEAGGGVAGEYWAVDPLDGTRNFLLGFPVVGVSVALARDGLPQAGTVCAPFLGLAFSGARGLGASSNGSPLRVSARPAGAAIVATGFPFPAEGAPRRVPARVRTRPPPRRGPAARRRGVAGSRVGGRRRLRRVLRARAVGLGRGGGRCSWRRRAGPSRTGAAAPSTWPATSSPARRPRIRSSWERHSQMVKWIDYLKGPGVALVRASRGA